ncbi:hypothetical protein AB9K35_17890 [Leisingera sp. XS_AS12]|uniref:hypothetical protein n=1 Tax=Leisingera sp. XS_AS12 TaxID=3241294 RepID=UPI003511F32C
MANVYLANGTPVATLQAEAKALKKSSGAKLTEAQDKVAQQHGYTSWQNMVENTISIDEEFEEHFTIQKRAGQDSYVLHLDFLEDGEYLDRSRTAFRKIFAKRDLLVGHHPGSVEHHVEFVFGEEVDGMHALYPLKEAPSARGVNKALNEIFISGDASGFISILNDQGFFDGLMNTPLDEVEFEAELMLILRKMGRTVGDRVLLNNGSSAAREIEVDWDRRCFANALDNGDVVISNGATGEDLAYKIVTGEGFKELEREMLKACGPTAATSGHGEIWMHDQVLAKSPETDNQPGM